MSAKILLFVAAVTVFLGVVLFVFVIPNSGGKVSRVPCADDFMLYYSSWRVFKSGGNPYNSELVTSVMRGLGRPEGYAKMEFFYPPWTLLALAPILELPFPLAAGLWFSLNIVFILITISAVSSLYPEADSRRWSVFLSGILFFPSIQVIAWGQVGLLITAGLATALWATMRRKDILAGLIVTLLTIKPHLFIGLVLPVLYWFYTSQRYRAVWSFLVVFAAAVGVLELWSPGICAAWWSARKDLPLNFRTDVLAGAVRGFIFDTTGRLPPLWPIFALPAFGFASSLFWLKFNKSEINWRDALPPLLCLSIMCAPYAWAHDLSVLLIVQISIVCWLNSAAAPAYSNSILSLLILSQVFAVAWVRAGGRFAWISVELLLVWFFIRRRLFADQDVV